MTNPFRRKTDPTEITQYIADIKEMMAMRDRADTTDERNRLTLNIHIANEVLSRLLERAGQGMGGTPQGGQKLKQTLIAKLGGVEAYKAFMSEVGSKGGKAVHTKPRGFAAMPRERLSAISKQGGAISKRKARNG